ncbi:MAG: phosphopantothenoylcysteine decarboxylase [Thermoanaerobaculales bacterium]|nr:phosphopantothenoylcysteine decarboxylase [Thermoanaerobaculales bacterium]
MKILITAGGTEEPVDGVRRLTNTSTGATGAVIARRFRELGAEVLLLHAERAPLAAVDVEREIFTTFADLEASLRRHLRNREWDAVVHLAAVSDYSVASIEIDGRPVSHGDRGKIGSGGEMTIRLSPNPKLIDSLKTWSRNPKIHVVGFKLTNDPDEAAREAKVRALLERGGADLVVHNDLAEITHEHHPAVIWIPGGPIMRTLTKTELAEALFVMLDGPDIEPRADEGAQGR